MKSSAAAVVVGGGGGLKCRTIVLNNFTWRAGRTFVLKKQCVKLVAKISFFLCFSYNLELETTNLVTWLFFDGLYNKIV